MLPFACKDVASEPPTTVVIVDHDDPNPCDEGYNVFSITVDNIEPTEGWLNRSGKPTLTICFMHSFGKCSGRTGGDPSTCYQVHVKTDTLSSLRFRYVSPPRPFFTRMVHAQLSPCMRQRVSQNVKKGFKMQYLDYKVQDVKPSSGLLTYEAAYRRWLFSDEKNRDCVIENAVYQCENYAICGWCPNEEECLGIHAALDKAQVRDQNVATSLARLAMLAQSHHNVSSPAPASCSSSTILHHS